MKTDILKFCRYYKGQKECPYKERNIRSTYWRIEKIWVTIKMSDEDAADSVLFQFSLDFPDSIPSVKDVPVSLKATIYDQYYHFYQAKDGFVEWLQDYASLALRA